jgi:hypothetical protein
MPATIFGLETASAGHYAILLAILAASALIGLAVWMSFRTPGLRLRWLWCLAALITIFKLQLAWASSVWKFTFWHGGLYTQGLGGPDPIFSPTVAHTSFPMGALIVIWRLSRRPPRKQ